MYRDIPRSDDLESKRKLNYEQQFIKYYAKVLKTESREMIISILYNHLALEQPQAYAIAQQICRERDK